MMHVLYILSGICVLKGQASDIVLEMKPCYEIGEDLILNAMYNGTYSVRSVLWLYSRNRGGPLVVSLSDPKCQPFANNTFYPLSRMTYKCPATLGPNKFQVAISGLQANETGDVWGAQFALENGPTTQNSSSTVSVCTEPSDPQYLKCYNVTETSCDLIWTPGYDGGNNQTFVIMFREFNDSSWMNVTVPGSPPYTLINLQSGTTYLMQVYATNNVGNSNITAINCITLLQVSNVILNAASINNNIIIVTNNIFTTLTCTAGFSIPPAIVMLYIGDVVVHKGNASLTFTYIPNNSEHDKNVFCKAFNLLESHTVESPKYKLYVQDAPDANLVLSSTDINEDGSVDVICNASGRPDSYSYTFIQTWGSTIIPNKHVHNQGKLTLSPVQLQDSGKYRCIVNNGVFDRYGQLNQTAEVNVTVKVPPKIFLRQFVGDSENTFVRAPGDSLTLTVPVYAFPSAHTVFIEGVNATINNTRGKFHVAFHGASVTTVFYGVEVNLTGHEVYVQISNISVEDFTNYTLVLVNSIGTTKWTFSLIPHNVPTQHTVAGPIIGGILGAIGCITVVVLVYVLVLRRYSCSLPCTCIKKKGNSDSHMELSTRSSTYDKLHMNISTDQQPYEELKHNNRTEGAENNDSSKITYETLNSDIAAGNLQTYDSLKYDGTEVQADRQVYINLQNMPKILQDITSSNNV